jgi:hypothetical protein
MGMGMGMYVGILVGRETIESDLGEEVRRVGD